MENLSSDNSFWSNALQGARLEIEATNLTAGMQKLSTAASKAEAKQLKATTRARKAAGQSAALIATTAPTELCQEIIKGIQQLPTSDIAAQKKLAKNLAVAMKYGQFPTQLLMELDKSGTSAKGVLDSLPDNLKEHIETTRDLSVKGTASFEVIFQCLEICAVCQQFRAGKMDGVEATAMVVRASAKALRIGNKILEHDRLIQALPYVGVAGRMADLLLQMRSQKARGVDIFRAAVDLTSALSTAAGHQIPQLEVASAALGILGLFWTGEAETKTRPVDSVGDQATFHALKNDTWKVLQQPVEAYHRTHPVDMFSGELIGLSRAEQLAAKEYLKAIDPSKFQYAITMAHNEYELLAAIEAYCAQMKHVDPNVANKPPISTMLERVKAPIEAQAFDPASQFVLLREGMHEVATEIAASNQRAMTRSGALPAFPTPIHLQGIKHAQSLSQLGTVARLCIKDLQKEGTHWGLSAAEVRERIAILENKIRNIEIAIDAANQGYTLPESRLIPRASSSESTKMLFLSTKANTLMERIFDTDFHNRLAAIADLEMKEIALQCYYEMALESASQSTPETFVRFWDNMNTKYLPLFQNLDLVSPEAVSGGQELQERATALFGGSVQYAVNACASLTAEAGKIVEELDEDILDILDIRSFGSKEFQAYTNSLRELSAFFSQPVTADELLQMLPRARKELLEPLLAYGLVYPSHLDAWKAIEANAAQWVTPDFLTEDASEAQRVAFYAREAQEMAYETFGSQFVTSAHAKQDPALIEIIQHIPTVLATISMAKDRGALIASLHDLETMMTTLRQANLVTPHAAGTFAHFVRRAEKQP